jgi:transposase
MDSTDLHWCPDVGNGYSVQATQIICQSPGLENPWVALFGSLEYPTGEGVYTIHERKRHQEVANHLQFLLQTDAESFWFVVLDNASQHTTEKLKDLLASNQDRIELVWLPTYSPHLNLIERLWRLLRSQITRNQFYDHLKALCEVVVEWLKKLTFEQFCSLMGVDDSQLDFV